MSWLSSATGIHIGGKHHPLIDVKRFGTSAAEGLAALTGQSWALPLIEGASQKGLGTDSPGPLGYGALAAGTAFGPGGLTSHMGGGAGGAGGWQDILKTGAQGALNGLEGATGSGGWQDLVKKGALLGLTGAEVIEAARLSGLSDKFANQGWDISKGNWDANNPLRVTGRDRMLNPGQPDLGGLDAIRGAIPGGLPSGAQTLNGARSALSMPGQPGGPPALSGLGGTTTPQGPTFTPPPEGLSGGGGPIAPTQPKPGTTGFSPVVRY